MINIFTTLVTYVCFKKVELWFFFLSKFKRLLRTTAKILGLFVLIFVHFYAQSKYRSGNLNFANFWMEMVKYINRIKSVETEWLWKE